jgi:hypothetical protein
VIAFLYEEKFVPIKPMAMALGEQLFPQFSRRLLTVSKLLNQIKGKGESWRIAIRAVKMEPTVGEAQVTKGTLFYFYLVTPFAAADITQYQKSKKSTSSAEETRASLGPKPIESTW